MQRNRIIPMACFVLAGICAGLCAGFIIAARAIPKPIISESLHEAISDDLKRINHNTGGTLEKQDFSENKWLSEAYRQWYHSLSEVEQRVIKFHDDSIGWMLWLLGIGVAMAVIGAALRNKLTPRVQ